LRGWVALWAGLALGIFVGACAPVAPSIALAQTASLELTRNDITKLKTLDSSQWTVLGVRLGDSKEAAVQTLQRAGNIKIQEDPGSGRIYLIAPPTGTTVVMSLRVTQNLVTAINLVGAFSEWLQGDTRLLFRAFEDDSLRYKFLGREDHREAVASGTKEAPTAGVTYAYFKEGILLHYLAKRSADGKQVEMQREMVLIYPPKSR